MKLITILAMLWATAASAASPELHRLGAALALVVAPTDAPPPAPTPTPAPSGDVCEECNGTGKLGDGTIEVQCFACGGTGRKKAAPPPPAVSIAPAPKLVARQPGPRWTVGSTPPQSASTEYLRRHLQTEHGIDTSGYTREQLLALHDNAHNAKTRTTTRRSTSSCPTGTCPTR